MLQERRNQHDAARRAYAKVVSWTPDFGPGREALQRVTNGHHSRPHHGVVYVIGLIGKGPYKVEVEEQPTQAALLLADRILSATGKYTLPPTIAPVKVPAIALPSQQIDGLAISSNGRIVGSTQTITDVGQLALATHTREFPRIVARAVARRTIKKAVVYSGKDALNVRNPAVNLALDVAGVLWEASESADTRCWGLLPNTIQVLRFELPVGTHQLHLQPTLGGRPIGPGHGTSVEVRDGRDTLLLSNFPTARMAGRVLSR